MLDTAIVGGGLCGLALARSLHRQGRTVALFEARTRLGGRVLSLAAADTTARADLGATWFWPQTQPLMMNLVAELALPSFGQYDQGLVLRLDDPDKAAPAGTEPIHQGARRLTDGMASLTEALSRQLPEQLLKTDHQLRTVVRRETHVELHFAHGEERVLIPAMRVVLTVPPRLLAEAVRFEPALDESLRAAMGATPTWMAAQAKAIVVCNTPSWRAAGHSGNAFVRHEQAVLNEIFDACDRAGTLAALGGFVALSPALRHSFQVGLPMLIANQLQQVFGSHLEPRAQLFQDWAREPFTCSTLDADDLQSALPASASANSPLRQSYWDKRLYFAGTESAAYSAGHLEGALDAMQRVQRQITAAVKSATPALSVVRTPLRARLSPCNAQSLAAFSRWVSNQQQPTFEDYRQRINHALAIQQREQLTQRAMLAAIEHVLNAALRTIEALPFDTTDLPIERGRCALTPQVQSAFQGFLQRFVDQVLAFNCASCALSNFPHEHRLSKAYEQTILRDLAAAWQEFSLAANSLLLERRARPPPPVSPALPIGFAS